VSACKCAGPECFCTERKLEQLDRALTELQGFAERNLTRAEKSHVDAKAQYNQRGGHALNLEMLIQETRLHEAQRFLLVVRERIAEARR
jgi:hypothetical protein